MKDIDSSVKRRPSLPHPRRVCGILRGQGTLGQPFLPAPASVASAVREHAQVCSSLPHRRPAPPGRTQISMSPPVKRKQVLVSSRLQLSQVRTALRLAERKGRRSWGLGIPDSGLPPTASQLPPPPPPPDLAAVYSYTAARNSPEPPAKRTHTTLLIGQALTPPPPQPRPPPATPPPTPTPACLRGRVSGFGVSPRPALRASRGGPGTRTGYRSGN